MASTDQTHSILTIVCDSCEQTKPLTGGCQLGDADLCEDCMDAWRVQMRTCDHVWELYSCADGDGRICGKCSFYQLSEVANA